MSEIILSKITKSYGINSILENITFTIAKGERVALIGRNGSGKTTLFRIITGIELPDSGTVTKRKDMRLGYLSQIPDYEESTTVLDVFHRAFAAQFKVKIKMDKISHEMQSSTGNRLNELVGELGVLQHRFEDMGGYDIEDRIRNITKGLKISSEMQKRQFMTLSGGEKTRIILAKCLMEEPDLLLLDEPTNHLDIESIEWLEEFISRYKGAVFIISHDRYFLDRAINKIIILENKNIEILQSNYTNWLNEKEIRALEYSRRYKEQQKEIKNLEKSIKRTAAVGKAQGNPAMLRKSKLLEKDLAKIQRLEKPRDERNIKLSFGSFQKSSRIAVRMEKLSKSFDEKTILNNTKLLVRYKERVAILGKNGSGKSTLLKIIMNEINYDEGQLYVGPGMDIGYLDQELYFENEKQNLLECLNSHFGWTEGQARSQLAKFLFFEDDVEKTIEILSGGEKTRLKLLMLINKGLNMLILDEPTNHLDINSREVMENALRSFSGTLLFVSHDRYFINNAANKIVELENGKLTAFEGNYQQYKKIKEGKELIVEKSDTQSSDLQNEGNTKAAWELQKKLKQEKQRIDRQKQELEQEIEGLEASIAEKERLLNVNLEDYNQYEVIINEKKELESRLEVLFETWCALYE